MRVLPSRPEYTKAEMESSLRRVSAESVKGNSRSSSVQRPSPGTSPVSKEDESTQR